MDKRKRGVRTYKKLHRWPGLIISFFLLYFGITGIIMNHREFFAGAEINRKWLPDEYAYSNWNNSSVKGNVTIGSDSVLVYGNIGIWLTDSLLNNFSPFNHGYPEGNDHRKTFDVLKSPDGHLYAASQFGLYAYDYQQKRWTKFELDVDLKRFTGIEWLNDTIYAINRSYLFTGLSEGPASHFEKIELKAPEGYENKISLFETMWQIHSGEIFGLPGQLVVDALGLLTIFLSITGIIYFFFPDWMVNRIRRGKKSLRLARMNKWSLKWHNKIGAWTFWLLIILYLTGMFLRPPVLIAIARSEVKPVKYSHLDQPNPWYDKLRDLVYDQSRKCLMLSTSDGMFYLSDLNGKPEKLRFQPPVSVMGINVFEPYESAYLIGSFSGLFLWEPASGMVLDFVTGKPYQGAPSGRPVGTFMVTGMLTDAQHNRFMVDYNMGAVPLYHQSKLPPMNEQIIRESTISLWNFSLEMHTGRLFNFLLGDFYILIVPLISLGGAVVVLSGYLLWRKKYRNKRT